MSLFKKNPKNEESNNENVQQVESVDDSVVTSSLEQNQDIAEQKKAKTKKFQTEELEEPKPVEHKRIVLEKPKPVDASKIRPKKFISSSLALNIKIYNNYIDYIPSDFNDKMVKKLFIKKQLCNLPKDAKLSLELHPDDVERNLKVIVSVDKYFRNGVLVKQKRIFKPFYIIGFQTYALLVVTEKPRESQYRVNNIHNFAYREAQKIRGKKLSSRRLDPKKSNYLIEEDFIRARETKNWYIQQYVEKLNKMSNVQWECIPECSLNWTTKILQIKLYIKVSKIKNDIKQSKTVYADQFRVKLNNVLDFVNSKNKIIDIDTIMYLVALNAMYKSVKIFSYNTLYETYKILCSTLLEKGYVLKDISATNLSSLKIVDFSKHFFCKKIMFNDRLLHIMNLMSSHEEYYRMKYALTVQKNPNLLYSDFIVTEFKSKVVNELSTIIKNQESDYWNKKLIELDEINKKSSNQNKDFYINNFNVLDFSNHKYKNVEEFLMGVIKENKDEITRISKLGEEILRIDENPRFNQKELNEIRKASKKIDDEYKSLFNKSKSKSKKDKLYI